MTVRCSRSYSPPAAPAAKGRTAAARRWIAALAAGGALAIAGCSGGGATRSALIPLATASPASAVQTTAAVRFRVVIPTDTAASAAIRQTRYISPATNSISISQSAGATQTLSLAANSPNCTTASGTRACTIAFNAATGTNQTFAINLFASTDGTGTPLSAQTLVAAIVPGQANQLNVVFNGVVASLSVTLVTPTLAQGQQASTNVVVNALDASGNTIVGPGVYADANGNPIAVTLAESDTTGATRLAQTTVTQPATIALTYTGAVIPNVTLTASAPSITSAMVTLAFAATTTNVVRFTTSLGNIDVQLRPDAAPKTVANFLGYVKSGAYTNSFIHRSVPGFIFQGGGYIITPSSQINVIVAGPPVVNEFSLSNRRGTIAMAKLGNDPNSATTQWFFNESDANAATLDTQNGGFTVFGQVISSQGLAVMDAIAAVTVPNPSPLSPPLDQAPLINYVSGQTPQPSNLIQVSSITQLP